MCAAWLFRLLCKALPRFPKFCCFAGGLLAPVLNTVFFMGFLVLLFYQIDYVQNLAASLGAENMRDVHRAAGGRCRLSSSGVICCLVAGAVTLPVRKFLKLN